ncbi:hypothetical protein ABZ357_21365 [Streptomyces sp. NPDC005917]|uniref:hypothetical protein n=1 Tax=unclassified Streptomyces TaxID=2593676 RepID=UPI0033D575F0
MRVYQRSRDVRSDRKQPLAARVAKYLRDRRGSGLATGATVDMIGTALRVTDRRAIREALELLVAKGLASVDHGPQGLADQRRPDTWSWKS